jgi:hypothetical protein
MTSTTNGGFGGNPLDALAAPASEGGCCGSAASSTPEPASGASSSGCCGTAPATATNAGGCCG